MGKLTRRLFLKRATPALAVGAAMTAPVVAAARLPTPSTAWADLLSSLDGLVPEGARIQVFGSAKHCRVEFLQTFMEPISPKQPGQMPVEWITGSYRLTENGWESEGRYHGRAE